MRVTILGCGSSAGVPQIGCGCSVCLSSNPKNKRTRVSVLVETRGKHLLIDSSPDFYQQALREQIPKIDAVLYTHEHSDHTHGLADLRAYNIISDKPIDIYSNSRTMAILKTQFSFAFKPPPSNGWWYAPCLTPHIIPDDTSGYLDIEGISVGYFVQQHGRITSLGFRIGNFAYSTDVDGLSDEAFSMVSGTKLWIVDCLRYKPSPSHAHLEATREWIARAAPEQAVLTHMSHDIDYDILFSELPANIQPAYDGMTFTLED